jgi:hypothetical protein
VKRDDVATAEQRQVHGAEGDPLAAGEGGGGEADHEGLKVSGHGDYS